VLVVTDPIREIIKIIIIIIIIIKLKKMLG